MKETVNVSIASQAFTLDRDAYELLSAYLNEIQSRLDKGEDEETYADIEARIAEIFLEKRPSPMMVITISIVRETMTQMGAPSDFGTPNDQNRQSQRCDNYGINSLKSLRRSQSDRLIAGVCGGLAHYLGVDVTVVRLVAVILIFICGISLWFYILLWFLIPISKGNNDKIR